MDELTRPELARRAGVEEAFVERLVGEGMPSGDTFPPSDLPGSPAVRGLG